MAKEKEAELPQDQNTDGQDAAAAVVVADVPTPADPGIAKAEATVKKGVLAAMEGTTGALHSVHTHLQEIVPHLRDATAQANGHVKDFLHSLVEYL